MKETMTIHKALSELKTLDKRINKEMAINFFATEKASATKTSGIPIADFMNSVKDALKGVTTLVNRRNAIKQAVTKSNALTKVTIAGKEYTVAEAIDMKSCGMGYFSVLLNRISTQYESAKMDAARKNGDSLDRRADEYIRSMYENADMKNMSDELKKVRDTFMEAQTTIVLDPISAEKTIRSLSDKIDSFMTEVDAALSVSNALTTIEVEYEAA